jgi:predicted RNase H-like nuclease (RuvC/YqgF family)
MKRGKYFEQTIISRLEKENEELRARVKGQQREIKELKAKIREKDKREDRRTRREARG